MGGEPLLSIVAENRRRRGARTRCESDEEHNSQETCEAQQSKETSFARRALQGAALTMTLGEIVYLR
jgi:hypothetical protein